MQSKGATRRMLQELCGYGLIVAAVFLGPLWWWAAVPLAILGGWMLENLGGIEDGDEP